MAEFLALVVSGGVSGAIFAVMAAGLVLTLSTSGIFNLAHGAIAFSVSYLYFQLNTGAGLPVPVSALVSVLVFAPLLGFTLNRVLLRRLAAAAVHVRLVGTIGLLVALPNLILWVVDEINAHGGTVAQTPQGTAPGLGPEPARIFHPLPDLVVDSNQLIILIASAGCAAALWLILRHSRLGLYLRADVDRRHLAELRGINTRWISALAWVFSSCLAGLGGILLSPFFGVDSGTYTLVVLGSMAAVVLAGLRSLPIAFAGGLLIGIVQNLIAGYSTDLLPGWLANLTGLRPAIPFILAIAGLVVLGRRRGRTAGTRSAEAPPTDHRAGLPVARRLAPWAVFSAALMVCTVFFASSFWAFLIAQSLVLSTIFLSFVVVTGIGGMVSLAQATFVTAGGFAAGWLLNHQFSRTIPVLMTNGRVNFLIAAAAGGAVAGALGVLIALVVRRLGVLSLALATLCIAFIADLLVFQVNSIDGNSAGYPITAPSLGPFSFANPHSMAVLAFAVFGLATLVIVNLNRSATGRAMYAVRSSEAGARAAGLSPERTRVTIFVISAVIAGVGGVLFGVVSGNMTNTTAPPAAGLIWLAVVVTWGIRRPGGALLAGLAYGAGGQLLIAATAWNTTLSGVVQSSRFLTVLFGLGAIALAMDPDGMLSLTARQRAAISKIIAARRSRPARPEPAAGRVITPVPAEQVPAGRDAALVIAGLCAGYDGAEVLHSVSFGLRPGKITALLGPNGAGKSTLAAAVAGLIPSTRGQVMHRGHTLADGCFARARSGVFLVPEDRGVFPGLPVKENLAVWLRSPGDRGQAYARFPLLAQRRRRPAGLLSGGEQQMLALAAPLVRHPDVLIADEPTLGLAPLAIDLVREALEELRDRGTSILLIEEKSEMALALADEVILMNLGRIIWSGPRTELNHDRLTEAYLGSGGPAATTADSAAARPVPFPDR